MKLIIYSAKKSEAKIIITPNPAPKIVGQSAPVSGTGNAVAVAWLTDVGVDMPLAVAVAVGVAVLVVKLVPLLVADAVADAEEVAVDVAVAVAVGVAEMLHRVKLVDQDPPADGQQYSLAVEAFCPQISIRPAVLHKLTSPSVSAVL